MADEKTCLHCGSVRCKRLEPSDHTFGQGGRAMVDCLTRQRHANKATIAKLLDAGTAIALRLNIMAEFSHSRTVMDESLALILTFKEVAEAAKETP